MVKLGGIIVLIVLFSNIVLSYDYNYYNFQLENTFIKNIKVIGQTQPIINNITLDFFDDKHNKYDIINITTNIDINTHLYDKIDILFFLSKDNIDYGNCDVSLQFINDNNTFYGSGICQPNKDKTLNLYEMWVTLYFNNGSYTGRLINNNIWETYKLNNNGKIYFNNTFISGSGTNNEGERSFIYMINTSYGWALFGSQRYSSNSWNGLNKENAPSYFIPDINDSLEYYNEIHYDYVVATPNLSIIAYDNNGGYLRRIVTFNGTKGYTPIDRTTYKLEYVNDIPYIRVAKPFFYFSFFIQVGDNNYKGAGETLSDDATAVSGQLVIPGGRIIPGWGTISNMKTSWHNKVDITKSWHTTSIKDVNLGTEITNHFLLTYCFDNIREIEEYGWWYYDNIKYTAAYNSDTFRGNAYEKMYTCWYLYSNWLKDYPDVRYEIGSRFLKGMKESLSLNNGNKLYRNYTFLLTVNDNLFQVDKWPNEYNPEFKYTGQMTPDYGLFYIYAGGLDNDEYVIYHIDCNKSDGTNLWFDDMKSNNSTYYSLTNFIYNSSINGLQSKGVGTASPSIASTTTSFWTDYSCKFKIGVLSSSTNDVNGYLSLFIRKIPGNNDYNRVLYRLYNSGPVQQTPGTSIYNTYLLNDFTTGVFYNNWENENVDVYIPQWNPEKPSVHSGSDNVINQMLYFNLMVVDLCYIAKDLNDIDNINYYCSLANKSLNGLNYLHDEKGYFDEDGYYWYSILNPQHDSGYLTNSIIELFHFVLGTNNPQITELPLLAYYNRHRENLSEGQITNAWSGWNALLGSICTKCTQYMFYEDNFDSKIDVENQAKIFMPDWYDNNIRFKKSNCTDIFAGKEGIYYVDNHIKLDWDGNISYLKEDCNNVRLTKVKNAYINDAYQIENTNNVYVNVLPIPSPCHYWIMYGYLDTPFVGDNEAYPKGYQCSYDSTYFDRDIHRWLNTYHKYDTYSLLFDKPCNLILNVSNSNLNTNFNVLLNNVFIFNFTTNEYGNYVSKPISIIENSNITITMQQVNLQQEEPAPAGGEEQPPAPAGGEEQPPAPAGGEEQPPAPAGNNEEIIDVDSNTAQSGILATLIIFSSVIIIIFSIGLISIIIGNVDVNTIISMVLTLAVGTGILMFLCVILINIL